MFWDKWQCREGGGDESIDRDKCRMRNVANKHDKDLQNETRELMLVMLDSMQLQTNGTKRVFLICVYSSIHLHFCH